MLIVVVEGWPPASPSLDIVDIVLSSPHIQEPERSEQSSVHTGLCCNPNLPFSKVHNCPDRLNPNRVKSLGFLKWHSPRPDQRSTCPAGRLCSPSKVFQHCWALAGSTGLNEQYGANTAVYVDRAERGVLKIEISTKFITLCREPFDTPPVWLLWWVCCSLPSPWMSHYDKPSLFITILETILHRKIAHHFAII